MFSCNAVSFTSKAGAEQPKQVNSSLSTADNGDKPVEPQQDQEQYHNPQGSTEQLSLLELSEQQGDQQLIPSNEAIVTNSGSEPISNGHTRKVSFEDIQLVQNLIERCLQLYMSQDEVIKTLLNQARIEPGFTSLVWQKLEEQNHDFFF